MRQSRLWSRLVPILVSVSTDGDCRTSALGRACGQWSTGLPFLRFGGNCRAVVSCMVTAWTVAAVNGASAMSRPLLHRLVAMIGWRLCCLRSNFMGHPRLQHCRLLTSHLDTLTAKQALFGPAHHLSMRSLDAPTPPCPDPGQLQREEKDGWMDRWRLASPGDSELQHQHRPLLWFPGV